MTKTASERAREINEEEHAARCRGEKVCFRLTEDQHHWDEQGVHTAEELDMYLLVSTHWDLYKEVYGVRPRWIDYTKLTQADVQQMIDVLWEQQERERKQEFEGKQKEAAAMDSAPLTHNPFAGLTLK